MLNTVPVPDLHFEQPVWAVSVVVPTRVVQHGVEADAFYRDAGADRLAHLHTHMAQSVRAPRI